MDERTEAIRELLNTFREPDADWFKAKLYRLIIKADLSNLSKLRKSFPDEVSAVEEWRIKGDDLFDEVLNENE